mmetsp:Transcript_28732/g.61022  ORF Transcript_28732/g.61022 Transcript_28732/m.61022 type:complete len:235 (-) Transcript_28732:58-762(-)
MQSLTFLWSVAVLLPAITVAWSPFSGDISASLAPFARWFGLSNKAAATEQTRRPESISGFSDFTEQPLTPLEFQRAAPGAQDLTLSGVDDSRPSTLGVHRPSRRDRVALTKPSSLRVHLPHDKELTPQSEGPSGAWSSEVGKEMHADVQTHVDDTLADFDKYLSPILEPEQDKAVSRRELPESAQLRRHSEAAISQADHVEQHISSLLQMSDELIARSRRSRGQLRMGKLYETS